MATTKESHDYNTGTMTFSLRGNLYSLTAMVDGLNDSEKRALLIGAMNMAQDSYASLTKDKGFTDAHRAERAKETIKAINSGTYKKERAERETVTKAKANIAEIMIKFIQNKYDEITPAELVEMKKYAPEQAAQVEAWQA